MPQLDYMVLAEYVRQDGGVIHIMGAGVDTIGAPVVPAMQPLGVALRVSFDTDEEVGEQHRFTVTFVGPDQPVLDLSGGFATPQKPPGVPEHWRPAIGIAIQVAVPLPSYGDYSCELSIDDDAELTKSFEFRVVRPGPAAS